MGEGATNEEGITEDGIYRLLDLLCHGVDRLTEKEWNNARHGRFPGSPANEMTG